MDKWEYYIDKLVKQEPELTREIIEKKVAEKRKKIGTGVITDLGALCLIVSDYGGINKIILREIISGKRDLSGVRMNGIDLGSIDLRGADLSFANLGGSNLSHADLRGVDLSYADLGGVDLRGANLGNSNLSHADLSFANLENANLSHADLSFANLENNNYWEAVYQSGAGANFKGTIEEEGYYEN